MLLHVLAAIHNTTTLLFGIFLSAFFLGVRQNKSNTIKLLLYSLAEGTVYLLSLTLIGETATMQIYPLFIHLPLALFLTFYYHYTFLSSCVSIVSAYLCCQVSTWIGMFALSLSSEQWCYYCFRIIATLGTYFFLCRYVCHTTEMIFAKDRRELWVIGFLPFVYYIFDYATNVYTSLLYSGSKVVVEFLGFILCTTYLLFLFLYFKQYEEQQETLHQNQLMELMRDQSQKDLITLHQAQQSVSIMRHDMRHFLLAISSMIENDKKEDALNYIHELVSTSDQMAIQKYCTNELVNTVLSAQDDLLKKQDIRLEHTIQIPNTLPLSDVDVTAILSNGLENAMHAVSKLPIEQRIITLHMRMHDEKLLISIKNPCATLPEIKDGMPQSKKLGHGFGTKSIRYITEKAGGNCQFAVDGNYFVLRVIV